MFALSRYWEPYPNYGSFLFAGIGRLPRQGDIDMPRNATKNDYKQFTSELPIATYRRLMEAVEASRISRNQYVRKAIEKTLPSEARHTK